MTLDELFEDAPRHAQAAPRDPKARSSLWQIFAARAGTINGEVVQWLCDGDAPPGSCLRLMAKGTNSWLPWSRVRSIRSSDRAETRGRPRLHAMLEDGDVDTVECFLPVRHPQASGDGQVLGRVTALQPPAGEACLGFGQSTLVTDVGEADRWACASRASCEAPAWQHR